MLGLILGIIGAVAAVVTGLAKMLGVLEKDDDMEELGAKTRVAEKKLEDFDSTKAYIDYLKNEVELDREAFDNASDKEKLEYKRDGLEIAHKGVEEELGTNIPLSFLERADKQKLSPEDTKKTIEAFKEDGVEKYDKYFKDELDGEANVKTGEKVTGLYEERYPSLDKSEVHDKIDEDKMQN